jgi:hypothetical protein
VALPVARSVAQSVVQPVVQPVAQPVAQPVVRPVARPTVGSVARSVAKSVAKYAERSVALSVAHWHSPCLVSRFLGLKLDTHLGAILDYKLRSNLRHHLSRKWAWHIVLAPSLCLDFKILMI